MLVPVRIDEPDIALNGGTEQGLLVFAKIAGLEDLPVVAFQGQHGQSGQIHGRVANAMHSFRVNWTVQRRFHQAFRQDLCQRQEFFTQRTNVVNLYVGMFVTFVSVHNLASLHFVLDLKVEVLLQMSLQVKT
jgi:hypothetical protein